MERKKAVRLLIEAKVCLLQKEAEAKQKGEAFGKKEASLKAETLRMLERQEMFLDDFYVGEPVDIAPSHSARASR